MPIQVVSAPSDGGRADEPLRDARGSESSRLLRLFFVENLCTSEGISSISNYCALLLYRVCSYLSEVLGTTYSPSLQTQVGTFRAARSPWGRAEHRVFGRLRGHRPENRTLALSSGKLPTPRPRDRWKLRRVD